MPVGQHWRKQVADDAARAGLDFHRYRHSGRQIDHLVLHQHLSAGERDARGIKQVAVAWLAGRIVRFAVFGIRRLC